MLLWWQLWRGILTCWRLQENSFFMAAGCRRDAGSSGTEQVRTFTTGNGFLSTMASAPLSTQATVTLGGTNVLASASFGGMVTLISPFPVNTGALGVGNLPGVITEKFVFVPEPGTVLLLVSGAAGLIFIGRKRMKG